MSVLVGRLAPHFEAKAVVNGHIEEHFSLEQYMGKKYVIFFFYPKDFTFVCPTELIAFQKHLNEFEKRDAVVVACSTDTEYSHHAWVKMPRDAGGIAGVMYPIVADTNKTIADAYGVLAGEFYFDDTGKLQTRGELVAYRGLFLIDKNGIVQHEVINNMPIGRSVTETLRVLDALQHFEQHGEVCPMDWHKGANAMQPTADGVRQYLTS